MKGNGEVEKECCGRTNGDQGLRWQLYSFVSKQVVQKISMCAYSFYHTFLKKGNSVS